MSVLESLILELEKSQPLPADVAPAVADALASAQVFPGHKMRFLQLLAQKGETPDEVASLAEAFRALAIDPEVSDLAAEAIDVVGTGGDKSGSFNISTLTSIIVATAGVRVMKHGNRSITSKSGSADFLSGLGIELEAPICLQRKSLEELNFCFFFAPAYHPAFKEILPVRKALAQEGQRTIFNLLGPLINPGRPAYQLMGVYAREWVLPLAEALHRLGLRRGYVVHCALDTESGMDELSTAGDNHVAGFGEFHGQKHVWTPESLSLKRCDASELQGGTPEDNRLILEAILEGYARPGLIDTVCLNAGCALWIANRAASLADGIALARELLESGKVRDWLTHARLFYQQNMRNGEGA